MILAETIERAAMFRAGCSPADDGPRIGFLTEPRPQEPYSGLVSLWAEPHDRLLPESWADDAMTNPEKV